MKYFVFTVTGEKGESNPTRSNLLEENCFPKLCHKKNSGPICPPPLCNSEACVSYCGADEDAHCDGDGVCCCFN